MLGVLLVFVVGVLNVAVAFAVVTYFGQGPRSSGTDDFDRSLFRDETLDHQTTAIDESLDMFSDDSFDVDDSQQAVLSHPRTGDALERIDNSIFSREA